MKTIRTSFLPKPLSCFLAFLVLFVSCSTPDGNVILENENSFQSMSGEQVFRSILFKEGDFGKQLYNEDDIELMNSLDSEVVKQLEITKTEIINDINKNNSSYFDNFKKNILSNNHNMILATLIEARQLVKETVNEQNNITNENLNSYKRDDLKKKLQKQNLYGKKACVAVVIVVLVLVLLVLVVPAALETENNRISRLENEQTVSKIVSINSKIVSINQ